MLNIILSSFGNWIWVTLYLQVGVLTILSPNQLKDTKWRDFELVFILLLRNILTYSEMQFTRIWVFSRVLINTLCSKFFILICRFSVKPCWSYHFDIIWIMPHHSTGHMHSCAYFTLVTALSQNNKKNIEAVPFVSPSAL